MLYQNPPKINFNLGSSMATILNLSLFFCSFQRYIGLHIFPMLMVLSQLVMVGVSIRNIVYDKENRLEEICVVALKIAKEV